jgi:hypothetical protein
MDCYKKNAAPASGRTPGPSPHQARRKKTLAIALFILAGAASILNAQARPAGTRLLHLQAGGGFATAASDYLPSRFHGVAAWVDLDFTPHLGVEGNFHFVKDSAGSGIYEKTYEVGGRYRLSRGRLEPYARAMYGRGVFNFAYYPGYGRPNLAYNMVVAGGGLDYRVLPHISARADVEYERWFGFPPPGLTPTLLTLGAAYHF